MSTTEAASLDLAQFCARYVAAWNGRDATAMADLVTDDIVWQDPALPAPARGLPAVQEFMRTAWATFPDLHFDETEDPHCTFDGGRVAWRWRMRGTMTGPIDPPGFAATGRTMEVEGVDLWRMRDGRIARYRAYYDVDDLARQLGIAPAHGSRAEKAVAALQRLQARAMRRRAA
ncbi:MAG: hypothetical protein QOH72_5165 [Solirubrobacteraceae bacterium]|jgi:steroid delta-isomerase-like uncharacterized protein|nr:hypothetical protein [Solirubrobacteraceae bacterium]